MSQPPVVLLKPVGFGKRYRSELGLVAGGKPSKGTKKDKRIKKNKGKKGY